MESWREKEKEKENLGTNQNNLCERALEFLEQLFQKTMNSHKNVDF